jgi:hypothetical protein
VRLEAGELPHDPYVFETRLLADLAEEARFQLLVRIEPSRRHLDSHAGVLGILEDEQLRLPIAHPGDIGDDASPLQSTSSSACGIRPRAPSMRT